MTNFFKEQIGLKSIEDVVKLHMFIKSYQLGHNLSKAEIDTLYELYKVGYSELFYKNCVDKGYFKTKQTVRNCVTKLTNCGILSYKKRGERYVAEKFVPRITSDRVIFQYLIGNLDDSPK